MGAGPVAQEDSRPSGLLNSTPEGTGHAGAMSRKEHRTDRATPQLLPWHLPQRKSHHHTPSPPATSPFPPAVSMATVILLVNKNCFSFSQRSPKMRHPCLSFTQVFLPLKARHHITQADLSTPRAETVSRHTTKGATCVLPQHQHGNPNGPISGKQEIGHFSKHSCDFFLLQCLLAQQLQ